MKMASLTQTVSKRTTCLRREKAVCARTTRAMIREIDTRRVAEEAAQEEVQEEVQEAALEVAQEAETIEVIEMITTKTKGQVLDRAETLRSMTKRVQESVHQEA